MKVWGMSILSAKNLRKGTFLKIGKVFIGVLSLKSPCIRHGVALTSYMSSSLINRPDACATSDTSAEKFIHVLVALSQNEL